MVLKGGESQGPMEMSDDGRINLTIFTEDSWRRWLVKDHNLQAIACLYLPSSNVLLNRHDWSKEFQVDRKKLRFSALRKASSSLNRARIYWLAKQDMFDPLPEKRLILTKEDEEAMKGLTKLEAEKKAKKMIVHGLRTVLMAKQLFDTGHIIDLHCGVPIWRELEREPDADWSYFAQKWEPRWKEIADAFPADSAQLPGPSSPNLPPILHRMDYLLTLPSFQQSFRSAIMKELHLLNRELCEGSTEPYNAEFISESLKGLFKTHFPKFPQLEEMTNEMIEEFRKMVQILQTDFDALSKLANKNVVEKGTKLGQEYARLAKGTAPHYTLLFGMTKLSNPSATQYLLSCALTHYDMMERYASTNAAPMSFSDKESETEKTQKKPESSSSGV